MMNCLSAMRTTRADVSAKRPIGAATVRERPPYECAGLPSERGPVACAQGSVRAALLAVACVLLSVSSARATDVDVAIALDKQLGTLAIQAEAIPEALSKLGQTVGVRITIDEAAVDMLPWGGKTRLKDVTIANASLRVVLPQILDALGMTYEVRDDGLVVLATPPLERMNRRSTWDDLKLLRLTKETEYSPENFASFGLQYRISSKVDAPKMLATQLSKAGRGTVAEMLEVATAALGWVWFPDGDHLVIRTSEAQTANKMARRTTCRYTRESLARILIDLADKADSHISFEPGMMLKLPPNVAQSTDLILQNSSIRQAFEVLAANTGIRYEIVRTGIQVSLGEGVGDVPGAAPRPQTNAYIGKISLPSADGTYSYDFLLRADELPEDILEYRRQIIEEYIQKMRDDMAPNETIRTPEVAD